MKKLRLLAWLITLTMLCELLPFGAFAQSDIGQSLAQAVAQNLEEENSEAIVAGKCGDNLTWSLSSDGTLTISGTGICMISIITNIPAHGENMKMIYPLK